MFTFNNGVFFLILLALDLWAIMRIVRSDARPAATVLWTLLILLLPVIGLVIWALAGPTSGQTDRGYRPE
jgi:hypothetical protein